MNDVSLSQIGLLEVVALGAIIFLAFRLARRILRTRFLSRSLHTSLLRAFPLAEGAIWIIFFIWSLGHIFVDSTAHWYLVVAVAIVGFVGFSWFVLRDFFAGLILRWQYPFQHEEFVSIGPIEGNVNHVGTLSLSLEQQDGRIVTIPYTAIATGARTHGPADSRSAFHQFELNLPKTIQSASLATTLRRTILESPWSSVKKEPVVKLLREDAETCSFEVTVFAFTPGHFELLRADVEHQMKA